MYLSSKFISKTNEFNDLDKHISAPYFRREFIVEKKNHPEITICGLGFYRLFVNGYEITKGVLAPYISNPDDIIYYDNYEVSKYIVKGKNVIGVILGNGFLNNPGGKPWDFEKAPYRSAPKFALAFENGGKTVFEADEQFLTSNSPITFDDYRLGEWYDARKEQFGWNNDNFDSSSWDKAICVDSPKGEKRLCKADAVKEIEKDYPISITQEGDSFLYKFKTNYVGYCKLNIKGKEGQEIVINHGELIRNGKFDLWNITFDHFETDYQYKVRYTCKEGIQTYKPSFVYFGFQYVLVSGITKEQAKKSLLTRIIVHSDVKSAGKFKCSDGILNTLQENTRRSMLSNIVWFPTDCPQREKNGWTGDTALSADHMTLNFHMTETLKEWLNNIRKAQKPNGQLPGIIPTAGWGYHWGNGPAWDIAIVRASYYAYKYDGDKQILTANFDCMMSNLDYSVSKRDKDGLIAYGLGDWCQVSRDSGKYETDLRITDTLTMMDYCHKFSRIALVLGKDKEQKKIDKIFDEYRNSFRKVFVVDGKIIEEKATQTAICMAIEYGVFEEQERDGAFAQLLEKIKADDNHFNVGVLGANCLFRVLSEFGNYNLAYQLITQKTYPSYAFHLMLGATTLWEDFHKYDEKGNYVQGLKINSYNHHFWGDISAWFIRYVAGININKGLTEPEKVIIRPCYLDALTYCYAERDYMGGKIKVRWRRKNGVVKLKVSVPKGVKAEIIDR